MRPFKLKIPVPKKELLGGLGLTKMSAIALFYFCIVNGSALKAQITLSADFTNAANMKNPMPYHLDVYNRISPVNGFNLPDNANASLCLVRPLGGIIKNGGVDLTRDTYRWNEVTKKFETDFTSLKTQIDHVLDAGFSIFQIVLDNPSWDFQRNDDGSLPNNTYKTSTYGNAEPPKNTDAWAQYIRDVMNYLVTTYGQSEIEKIQFGVGREIGTAGHWTGTQEEFFRFYKKTLEAIQTVLPKAKVGSHFLWGSAGAKSWAPAFVRWCKTNNISYHFVGVSYYPFYHRAARTNFTEVYKNDFSVIKDVPEWDSHAKLEIHEFALIKSLNSAGNAFDSADDNHQNSFMVGLMKMFYENNMENVFQWGDGTTYSPAREHLLALKNNVYYSNKKTGNQKLNSNYVEGIFARSFSDNRYSIMAYNYNASPTSNTTENLTLSIKLPVSGNTNYRVRSGVYNKSNNTFTYSAWSTSKTPGSNKNESMLSFPIDLPVFAFLKYEVEIISATNSLGNENILNEH